MAKLKKQVFHIADESGHVRDVERSYYPKKMKMATKDIIELNRQEKLIDKELSEIKRLSKTNWDSVEEYISKDAQMFNLTDEGVEINTDFSILKPILKTDRAKTPLHSEKISVQTSDKWDSSLSATGVDFQTLDDDEKLEHVISYMEKFKKVKANNKKKAKKTKRLNVVVSLDSEWEAAKTSKNEIRPFNSFISMQYSLYFPDYPQIEVNEVVFKDADDIFSFKPFMVLLVKRIRETLRDNYINVESGDINMLLTGYFMGVDISGLAGWNFKDLQLNVIDKHKIFTKKSFTYPLKDTKLHIIIRDMALLAPEGGLKVLGEMVGMSKLDSTKLDEADYKKGVINHREYKKYKPNGGYYKTHMNKLLERHRDFFIKYALNDSKIALDYLKRVIDVYKLEWDFNKIPVTTSRLAGNKVDSMLKNCAEQKIFNPNVKLSTIVRNPEKYVRDGYSDLYKNSKNAFYGGFNCAFGCMVGGYNNIVDIDLTSAYNVSGALMAKPDYSKPFRTNNLKNIFKEGVYIDGGVDFKELRDALLDGVGYPFVLGVVKVNYKFPKDTTKVVMTPQRDGNNSPAYVLEGNNCYLTIIDALSAYRHNAKIELLSAWIPAQSWEDYNAWGKCQLEFLDMRQAAKANRDRYAKGSSDYIKYDAEQTLYKLAANSIYGKSSQGLLSKNSRDYGTNEMVMMPISSISDPVIASSYTAITRYLAWVLYDTADGVYGDEVIPMNITTDGYTFALPANVNFDFGVLNDRFNSQMNSHSTYYHDRLTKIGFKAGIERKGDQNNTPTRWFNIRSRFNGTVDVESVHAMGGIYFPSNIKPLAQVNEVFEKVKNGEIIYEIEETRLTNLTEMKFGTKNKQSGIMYEDRHDKRVYLQYDCAYKPNKWIGDLLSSSGFKGFGFNALPFESVKERDLFKKRSKIITERWNIFKTKERFECYLRTMDMYTFYRTDLLDKDDHYQEKAKYIFGLIKDPDLDSRYKDVRKQFNKSKSKGKYSVCPMAVYDRDDHIK